MAKATIKIEFDPGCSIEDAFTEAIRLASVLGVWIQFPFNGVTCLASENGIVEIGVDEYRKALNGSSGFKLAVS